MKNKIHHSPQPQESIFKGVLLAYFVLVFHVALIIGLGAIMLLFGGVVAHLPWILALGLVAVVGSCYLWWQHIKKRGKSLRDILRDPLFEGRSVEVTLLGGLASFKLGQPREPLTIEYSASEGSKQIQGSTTRPAEELTKLALLLKQDLITIDEYLEAKKDIMGQ
ncbi:MAG: hypothetical protein JRI70_01745 [Deltaproteobacteria bacterium]|nr:hypothetical protein [Deltaproteobacteria bacterium]MBW2171720.1 hypothetical protein [Deltaproteobacteria bacterium]MBW2259183.1 hypothetical protein [Deltaproteobacteria bacterium]